MLEVKSVKDLGNKWSGFHSIWNLEFNGNSYTLSKQNVVGGDDDNIYFYWSYYIRDNDSDDIVYSCNHYASGYIEWDTRPIGDFDWESFIKEVKEALNVELPVK